jgi:hypothetical protein
LKHTKNQRLFPLKQTDDAPTNKFRKRKDWGQFCWR